MALVHAEVSVWSKPWDHSFHIYGGQVCNTLMAGEFSSSTSVILSLLNVFSGQTGLQQEPSLFCFHNFTKN